ncbi:hypothetical protein FSP39_007401 [Pinctada imbricata]|uniref:Delta-like protein n=1 Tax=Pinctada imbricata TaxID=66713 RepID=A0AA88Y7S7_PINIB|nr:hypothetical protein FSP39_007401 [Pinctada imbricata]
MLAIYNKFGIKESGHCCNGSRDLPPCSMECQTFFSICLFHYVTELADDPTCTYGQTSTPVLGGNSINKSSFLSLNYFPVTMSFDFSWPRSFSLVIDANHDANNNVSATDRSQRILRIFVVDDLKPSSNWIFKDLRVNQSHVWFKYRVVCEEFYYGPSCEVFCRDRDDRFGHYVCNENGTKTCLPGWDGYFCQQAICSSSCNSSHGYCEEPYECRCRYGWTGLSCDQCLTNPGCIHGTCERPGECICNDGWIGKKCDIDLMYCVKHKPCLNGGTCTIDMFSNYSCSCLEGSNGRNCQNSVCNEIQCRNGGVCQIEGNKTLCKCRENFYGEQCQNTKVSCDDIQCLNEGTCYFGEFGAMCTCEKGYTGIFCEREINECDSHPCMNGEHKSSFSLTIVICSGRVEQPVEMDITIILANAPKTMEVKTVNSISILVKGIVSTKEHAHTKSIIQKIRNRGIRNQDKTGTKANKQKPPPYEKKRTPDMRVRPGAQEE